MGNDVVLELDYYEEDQEEVLSLRDLPLSPPSNSSSAAADHHHTTTASCRSSADFTFFEFHENDGAAADDIIFRGHLLPFAPPPPPPPPPPRRSLSASSASLTRHTSTNSRPMRPSRSLDCQKIHRNSSLNAKTERFSRNSSNSTSSRSSSSSDNPKLPAWYWLVLGVPARVPAEMDMKDIKNRQFRRSSSPASLFSGDRSSSSSSSSVSWRFLNVLSCKSHASVDVMNTTGIVSSK